MRALALALQLAVPHDIDVLPPLPMLHRQPDQTAGTSLFVRDEIRSGRCDVSVDTVLPGREAITIDLAVLVTAAGAIRAVLPRAIGCPSVEQYAAGVASRVIRGNVPVPRADQWFRMPITFTWIQSGAQQAP